MSANAANEAGHELFIKRICPGSEGFPTAVLDGGGEGLGAVEG